MPLIGLISDTHGLVRPQCAQALAGVEMILHAGDVGGAEVLQELSFIAPVRAVYGNVDRIGEPGLEREFVCEIGAVTVHVSHGHELGSPTPAALVALYAADVIVFGHTHRALVTRIGRQLVVNPGAAGPRRFHLQPSVARLAINAGHVEVEIVPLSS